MRISFMESIQRSKKEREWEYTEQQQNGAPLKRKIKIRAVRECRLLFAGMNCISFSSKKLVLNGSSSSNNNNNSSTSSNLIRFHLFIYFYYHCYILFLISFVRYFGDHSVFIPVYYDHPADAPAVVLFLVVCLFWTSV